MNNPFKISAVFYKVDKNIEIELPILYFAAEIPMTTSGQKCSEQLREYECLFITVNKACQKQTS